MGSSIPLYRSSEEEKRVTVIKAPHYPGIGPVDESGIPTAIRTVRNARVCVVAGPGTDSTKDGLSMALCIPMLLYNEDGPLCHLSSQEILCCVWQRKRKRICRSKLITQSVFAFLIENHENCDHGKPKKKKKNVFCFTFFPGVLGQQREKRRKEEM